MFDIAHFLYRRTCYHDLRNITSQPLRASRGIASDPEDDSLSAAHQDQHGVASSIVSDVGGSNQQGCSLYRELSRSHLILSPAVVGQHRASLTRIRARYLLHLPQKGTVQEWGPLTSAQPSTRGLASRRQCSIDIQLLWYLLLVHDQDSGSF